MSHPFLAVERLRALVRTSLLFAFVCANLGFAGPATAQFLPRWSDGLKPHVVALASGPNFLQAQPNGRLVKGPTDGAGLWETLRIYNVSRPDMALAFGDVILVQTYTGRFLSHAGVNPANFGVVAQATSRATALHFQIYGLSFSGSVGDRPFRLRRVSAPDPYDGDRDSDGRQRFYLAFDDAGALLSGTGATFTLTPMGGELVQVRNRAGRVMTAEGGGGREVTINRAEPGMWENFTLLNLSRPGEAAAPGDEIALQTVTGGFVGFRTRPSQGDQVAANLNRMTDGARFRVFQSLSPLGDHRVGIALRPTSAARGLLVPSGDRLVFDANARVAPPLYVGRSVQTPTAYRFVSGGGDLPDTRPFVMPALSSGERAVAIYAYVPVDANGNPIIDISDGLPVDSLGWLTEDVARRGLMGQDADGRPVQGFSLRSWLDDNTGGAWRLTWGGLYGPVEATGLPDIEEVRLAAAVRAGVHRSRIAPGGRVSSDQTMLYRMTPARGGVPGSKRGVNASVANLSVCCDWLWLAGRPRWEGAAAHEASHFLWRQEDRYDIPVPFSGDVAARFGYTDVGVVVERLAGPGPLSAGDRVRLKWEAADYWQVQPENVVRPGTPAIPAIVNLVTGADAATVFTITSANGTTGRLLDGSTIRLAVADSPAGAVIGVAGGGHNPLVARPMSRWSKPSWTEFHLDSIGAPLHGSTLVLTSAGGRGDQVVRVGRNLSTAGVDLNRGYTWTANQGIGPTGPADNANLHGKNLVSAWDRIRLGWAKVRYLTPDQRGCYRLQPFLVGRETIVLFDPLAPADYYIVELRERLDGRDEVPGSGFYVTWNNDDFLYWEGVRRLLRDDFNPGKKMSPALISATKPGVAANPMLRPMSLHQNAPLGLDRPTVAFGNPTQQVVLPLGDGSPSRFAVSFDYSEGAASGALCIH